MSLSDQSQQWLPTSAQVTVQRARGLRSKGKNGTNDAYVIMQVGKEKFCTAVQERSMAPLWEEEATFPLLELQRAVLRVQVLHRVPVGADKLLGQVEVNLAELNDNKARNKTEWFKLLDKNGKADKDRGEVLMDIQFFRNNLSASMFDLSSQGKSRSRVGKLKDKLRGKKKEGLSDSASAIVPSVTQVMTDSEEEEEGDEASKAKKKKNKLASLFAPKSNLQRIGSKSMSTLNPLSENESGIGSGGSPGISVESPEGKKKFTFLTHKRTSSTDSKQSSTLCINGSHVYSEEPKPRTSVSSSGRESLEELQRTSEEPNLLTQRAAEERQRQAEKREREEKERERQRLEEERVRTEREREEKERKEREAEQRRKTEKEKEEQRRKMEEQEEKRRLAEKERMKEEERKRAEEERARAEARLKEEEKRKREEEERMREEEAERVRREEDERKKREEKKKREEGERKRKEEAERVRREEEERIRKEEGERMRREEEERKKREEKKRMEEEERMRREAEEKKKKEERLRREEEERVIREEEERKRKAEENRRRILQEEEAERLRVEEKTKAEMERKLAEEKLREEEERMKAERERKRKEKEEEEKRLREEELKKAQEKMKLEEERRNMEEEKRKERQRREEQERQRAEEEKKVRMEKKISTDPKKEEKKGSEDERPVPMGRSAGVGGVKVETLRDENFEGPLNANPFEEHLSDNVSSSDLFEEPSTSQPPRSARISAVKPSVSAHEVIIQSSLVNTNPFLDDCDSSDSSLDNLRQDSTERTSKKGRAPLPPQSKPEVPKQVAPSKGIHDIQLEETVQHLPSKELSKRQAPLPPESQKKTKEVPGDMDMEEFGAERETTAPQDEPKALCIESMKTRQEQESSQKMDPSNNQAIMKTQSGTGQADTSPRVGPVVAKHNKGPAPQKPSVTCTLDKSVSEDKLLVHGTNQTSSALQSENNANPSNCQLQGPNNTVMDDTKTKLIFHAEDRKIGSENLSVHSAQDLGAQSFVSKTEGLPNMASLEPAPDTLGVSKKKSRAPLPPGKLNPGGEPNSQTLPKENHTDLPENHSNKKDKEKAEGPDVGGSPPSSVSSSASTQFTEKSQGTKACVSISAGTGSRLVPLARVVPTDAQLILDNSSAGELGGAPPSVIRALAVKPLSAADRQTELRQTHDNKAAAGTEGIQLKTKAADVSGLGPYSQLTQAELISLVVRQQEQMSQRDSRIAELEQYIDNLLVRIMEERPSILMSVNSQRKAV